MLTYLNLRVNALYDVLPASWAGAAAFPKVGQGQGGLLETAATGGAHPNRMPAVQVACKTALLLGTCTT